MFRICLSLLCNLGHSVLEHIFTCKIVMTYTLEIRVKRVNQRNSCGDIEFNNFFVRDLVQILDECPKAAAMCNNPICLCYTSRSLKPSSPSAILFGGLDIDRIETLFDHGIALVRRRHALLFCDDCY